MKKNKVIVILSIILLILAVFFIQKRNEVTSSVSGKNITTLAPHVVPADRKVVNIPDANFKNRLLELFKSEAQRIPSAPLYTGSNARFLELTKEYVKPQSEMEIYEDEMELIFRLVIRNYRVSSIVGIEKAINIQKLDFNNNQITSIEPVKDLTKIDDIYFTSNRITNMEPLRNLTNLIALQIGYNRIEDISVVSNFPELRTLYLTSNLIENIEPVSNLSKLQILILQHNKIENISPISNLPILNNLHLGNNKLTDISPLQNYTRINTVNLSQNFISDFSTIKNVNIPSLNKLNQTIVITPEVNKFEIDLVNKLGIDVISENPGLIKNNDGTYSLVNPEVELRYSTYLKSAGNYVFNVTIHPVKRKEIRKEIKVIGGDKNTIPETIEVEITNDKGLPTKTATARLNADKTAYIVVEEVQNRTENNEIINYIITPKTEITNYNKTSNEYRYVSPKVNFVIEKRWQGGSTLIPEIIEVKIKRKLQSDMNYTDVKTIILRKNNNWQLIINDLDQTDENANVYEYAIEEVTQISNFTGSVNNFEITNTYTSPEHTITKDIEVIGGGVNKPTVKVRLIRNNEILTNTEKVVDLNNTNIAEFTNMLTTNNDGVNYDYKFEIVEVTNNPNEENGTYTINENTLTFVPKKISLNASVQYVNGRNLFEDVQVALFKNGQIVTNTTKTITVSEITANIDNKKEFTIDNLDKVTINNELINYEIKALTDVDKFNKTTNTNNNSFNTIYTHENETQNIEFKVNIVNGPLNSPNVTVNLKENNNVVDTQNVGNTTSKQINSVFTNKEVRELQSGDIRNYIVDIVVPENYKLVNRQGNEFTIEYVSPKVEFTATKEWENGPSVKPEVTFNLYRDGQKVEGQSKVVPRGTNTVTWDNLDQTDINANIYTYSVEEESILGYEKVIVDNNTIKNSYKVDETGVYSKNITVIGGPSIKPTVTIKLKKNTNVIEPNITKTVNTNNENRFEFTNLPKTDILGNENTYDVEIENVENYVISRDTNGNITLTYVSPTDEIVVNKVFVGGNSNTRPTITLQVKKNDQVVEEKVAVNTGDNINYRATFNLPRTENDGSQITYTVDEKVVPVNFVKSITGMTVTNTYVSPKTEVSYKVVRNNGENIDVPVYLIKNDNKVDGTNKNINTNNVEYNNLDLTDNEENVYNYKVGVNENELPNGYTAVVNHNTKTITVNYVSPEKLIDVNIPVNNGNKDLIPNTIEVSITNDKNLPNKTVTATLNDTKTAYVINDVSVDLTNNNAETVNYTIKALTPITNYVLNDTKTEYNYVSPKVNKEIVVNRVGGKEQTIEFRIRQNNEVLNPDSKASIKATNTRTTNTFTNLDKTNIAGVDYTYTTESLTTLPNGYTIVKDSEFEYTIKYVSPQTKTITIDKVWNGGSTLIPDTIEVKVKRKTQKDINYKDVKTVLLRKDNNWQLVVNNLENTDENEEIYEYAIEEVTQIANFTGSVNNFEITNTYTSPKKQEEVFIPIIGGKKENIPNEVEVIVKNDSGLPEKVIKATLNGDKTGYITTEEVDATNTDGTPIEYTFVPKTEITNYPISENKYIFAPNIINVSKTVNIIGGKTLWEDIVVKMYSNDEYKEGTELLISKEELLANNGVYEYSIPNMHETDNNGDIIVYSLRTDKQLNNFTREFRDGNIYFVYQNETKTIPYTVEFVGGNPNNRPQVTVNLKNQNDTIDTKTTTGNTVFENVIAKNPDGSDINHTIEVSVNHPNYIVRDNKVIYVSPKIDFTATKQWENGKTRQDVTLNLFRDGVNQNMPKTVREGTVTWTDLDKTDNFENIYTYTMEEETTLENYRKEYNNDKTEVKNVYVIPKTTLENKVIFPNDKLKDVKISILKDGEKQENTQKTVNTTTLVNYSDLDKTDINGNDITYTLTVDNVLPDGYTWKLDQDKNIIIEYTSPKISLTVTKAWINGDNLIPDNIEVSLKRRKQGTNDNFVEVQKINVEKSNNWTKEITNLDKTDENANVYEYVVEEITEIENFTNRVENFKITNIYNIPTKEYDITVNVDGGDKTKIPNTIEVDIIGKDGVVKTTTLTLNEDKTAYVNKVVLDKTDNKGDLIDYKVDVKTNVENYNKDNTGSNATTTITYVSPKVDVTREIHIDPKLIEKLKESGKTTIDLNLSKDNQNIGETKSVNLDDFINGKTTITFNDLDKTDFNGKDYIYDVNTINLPDKYLEIKEGNVIRIEKEVEHFDKKITLEYNGGKVRPTVEVEILKDNKVIKTVKLTNSELILKDLESNDKTGHEFSYTTRIKNEDKIVSNNYEIKLEDTKENTKITLNYIIPKTDETFKILYPGSNGENPQVKVQILRDGIPTGEVITLNGEKEYTFKNLDKTDFNGNEYNYTISVIGTINGYETQVSISGKVLVVTKNIENGKILPYAGVENNLSTIAIVLVLIITSTYSNIMIKQSNNMNVSGRIRKNRK